MFYGKKNRKCLDARTDSRRLGLAALEHNDLLEVRSDHSGGERLSVSGDFIRASSGNLAILLRYGFKDVCANPSDYGYHSGAPRDGMFFAIGYECICAMLLLTGSINRTTDDRHRIAGHNELERRTLDPIIGV
jgi:hypothetical protein